MDIKKIIIGMIVIAILPVLILFGVALPAMAAAWIEGIRLDAWEASFSEKAEVPDCQYRDRLIIDSKEWRMRTLLEEKGIDGSFREALAVDDDRVWFVYTCQEEESKEKVWNLATLELLTGQIQTHYTEVFGDHYRVNNGLCNDYLQGKSGFYHDGKIVLTDHEKLTEYDIETGKTRSISASEYDYPDYAWSAEITDHKTVRITKGALEAVLTPESLAQSSEAFAVILESGENRIWNGTASSKYLFDNVQTDGEKCYIFCRMLNWNGDSYAFVFRYDMESEALEYCFYLYTDDVFNSYLSLIPRIR